MVRRLAAVTVALTVSLAFAASTAYAQSVDAGPDIVVLKDTADAKQLAAQHSKRYGFRVEFVYRYALKGYAASLSASQISALEREPSVLFVERPPDPTEVPPTRARQLPPQPTQVPSVAILRIDGDESSAASGDGRGRVNVNVAVIDTGIDSNHPDLNVAGGTNCTGVGPKNDISDREVHGTLVSGFIGALDNAIGRVGVAPGARLFSVPAVTDVERGLIPDANLICGVDWVTSTRLDGNVHNDIAVANMSLGDLGRDDSRCGRSVADAVHYAVCGAARAGVTSVASAGNEAIDLKDVYPATYSEVLTATAMADSDGRPGGLGPVPFPCDPEQTADDQFAFFSNFVTLPDDLAHTVSAPGVCGGSTYPGGLYAATEGTSFSSPVVAGTVALCIANGPCAGKRPAAVIRKVVDDTARYNTSHPGYGFVGDPLRPVDGHNYGYLIRAGLY